MKRVLPAFLVLCLLLCGCQLADPETTRPVTEPTQALTEAPDTTVSEPSEEETTAPATEPATEPAEPQGKVTVYLVERTDYYDSGYVAYSYDENYNIVSYDVYTIENDLMYSTVFTEHNTYGMPCKFSQHGENWTIAWFEDGKIKEAQEGSGFSGYQYEYDLKGDITEKRGYYEGILKDTVYYEYNGEELSRVYCVDWTGEQTYECKIENGILVEKAFSATAGDIVYYYEYDENGCLIEENSLLEGEIMPVQIHTYMAVEVDADRAMYLLEQQKYLLSIT